MTVATYTSRGSCTPDLGSCPTPETRPRRSRNSPAGRVYIADRGPYTCRSRHRSLVLRTCRSNSLRRRYTMHHQAVWLCTRRDKQTACRGMTRKTGKSCRRSCSTSEGLECSGDSSRCIHPCSGRSPALRKCFPRRNRSPRCSAADPLRLRRSGYRLSAQPGRARRADRAPDRQVDLPAAASPDNRPQQTP